MKEQTVTLLTAHTSFDYTVCRIISRADIVHVPPWKLYRKTP